jgi:thiamine-phosphate pyrophosphorylase
MMEKHKITGGIYLVLDPSMEKILLLDRLREALEGGVQLLQIWDNWPVGFDKKKKNELVTSITHIARPFAVPVLINEEWELLLGSTLAGVHFDQVPDNYESVKEAIPSQAIVGITCGNDLKIVEWADQQGLDYISFCAMFPSVSAGDCEIVSPDTIQKARSITSLPLFVSGGITPENILQLKELDIAGVAVISGILSHTHPKETVSIYTHALKELENEKITAK